jgi:hypothetical protein
MNHEEDWPAKYPWRHLPRTGTHSFKAPKGVSLRNHPLRGQQRGYVDADGNEWRPHPKPGGGELDFHWDVQHADGSHTNVGLDGEVHHGQDNFSGKG